MADSESKTMEKRYPIERRKHKRFPAQDGAYVELEHPSKIGRISDISKGGLTFWYVDDGKRLEGHTKLRIYLTGNIFGLDGVHSRVVSDFGLADRPPFVFTSLRRCGVEFDDLTHMQVSRLEYFIRNHFMSEV